MGLTLTPDELKDLTGHSRSAAQIKDLQFMGIEYKIRRDGTVAVSREHFDSVMSGNKTPLRKAKNDDRINWEAASA